MEGSEATYVYVLVFFTRHIVVGLNLATRTSSNGRCGGGGGRSVVGGGGRGRWDVVVRALDFLREPVLIFI